MAVMATAQRGRLDKYSIMSTIYSWVTIPRICRMAYNEAVINAMRSPFDIEELYKLALSENIAMQVWSRSSKMFIDIPEKAGDFDEMTQFASRAGKMLIFRDSLGKREVLAETKDLEHGDILNPMMLLIARHCAQAVRNLFNEYKSNMSYSQIVTLANNSNGMYNKWKVNLVRAWWNSGCTGVYKAKSTMSFSKHMEQLLEAVAEIKAKVASREEK